MKLARRILLAYVLLTFWQVAGHREDWPLSGFPMFSGRRAWGSTVQRTSLVGVTDRGEHPLPPSALSSLMSAPRLRQTFDRMRKASPAEQARFTDAVASLLKGNTPGQQAIWGLRLYQEGWRVRPGLEGIEHPKRRLEFAEFLAPESLLLELREGGEHKPVLLPSGDWLADPGASACEPGCSVIRDAGAAGGQAVRLTTAEGTTLSALTLAIPPGRAKLFVRMRTNAPAGHDALTVTLDGETPKSAGPRGLGNYKADLPYDGWVWASVAPGWPPLELTASAAGPRTLVLRAELGVVDVDQVWLARTRPEVPIFTAPVEAGR